MSMAGYTKLFNSILASTIWRASDTTRIVWITMLAMADKDGVVEGSVPGLADFARVDLKACQAALVELLSPDEYSRSSEHDGRRIEELDGVGWRLLNHSKYRAKMSEDERRQYNRIKQAEWRERKKMSNPVNDSQLQSAMSAQAEADTEAKKETTLSGKPDVARQILQFLNNKSGFNYQPVPSNIDLIKSRLKEYSEEQLKMVIAKKVREWKGTEFEKFLRPKTLFNKTNLANYTGELVTRTDDE